MRHGPASSIKRRNRAASGSSNTMATTAEVSRITSAGPARHRANPHGQYTALSRWPSPVSQLPSTPQSASSPPSPAAPAESQSPLLLMYPPSDQQSRAPIDRPLNPSRSSQWRFILSRKVFPILPSLRQPVPVVNQVTVIMIGPLRNRHHFLNRCFRPLPLHYLLRQLLRPWFLHCYGSRTTRIPNIRHACKDGQPPPRA